MNLPLHKDAQQVFKEKGGFHAGLWFDRFFDRYDNGWKVPKDEKGKLDWINTVTGSKVGDDNLVKSFAARQKLLLEAQGGTSMVMATDWHFVTGMGNNHPVENGFVWHPTLGVPYLTGATVKGMLRGYCEVWMDMDKEKTLCWFESPPKEPKKNANSGAGELIFFDAVPTQSVELKADVMTPHYGKWYAEGASRPNEPDTVPADWHDPMPLPFLVVNKGQFFQFGIAKRPNSNIDLDKVCNALTDALQWLGAGAKTAAGYGRFSEDKNAKQAREKQQKEFKQARKAEKETQSLTQEAEDQGYSGLAAELYINAQKSNWSTDTGSFTKDVSEWLSKVESLDDTSEQKQSAELLAEFLEMHHKGVLANPNKTKGKKNKPVYKPNVVKLAIAINQVLAL